MRLRTRLAVLCACLLPAWPLAACEVTSVAALADGDGAARIRIAHTGEARVRRQPRDDLLVLFVEGCRSAPGSRAADATPAPIAALRWAWHPENDAVWVVAEIAPGAAVDIDTGGGTVEVRVAARGDAATGWPRGFRVVRPLPPDVVTLMRRDWRPDCPVPMEALALVQVTHLGFDGREQQGDLVVHGDVAEEVLAIFVDLLRGGCAIERVHLADLYADDAASMAANNSSAFACRRVTGSSGRWSVHAEGRAIDLNPVQNPYVRGDVLLPEAGRGFRDRSRAAPGLIRAGDACHAPFARRGWRWGGDFRSLKDWQHFEKPRP